MEGNKVVNGKRFANESWRLRPIIAAESERSAGSAPGRRKPEFGVLTQLIICFSDFSLWFSLPLSVLLSSGWIGLIFHWRVITLMASAGERAFRSDFREVLQPPGGVS
jgi:hypothetical protein